MKQDLRKKNFTLIYNKVIEDKRISLRAKGLFIVLARLPENWKYSERGLLKIINEENGKNNDGLRKLKSAITELEENHYLLRIRERNNNKISGIKYILTDKI